MTAHADFDRLIAELSAAHCRQDARDILQANQSLLDRIAALPRKQSDSMMERIQNVIAELPED
jgi:hypothetical protein